MNVLIVGSNGIIGAEIVAKLSKADEAVLYLVDKVSIPPVSNAIGFEFDCLDEKEVEAFLRRWHT